MSNFSGSGYNFKKIQTVPSHTEFIDIVLSKTQRKTPTVVHKGYAISRIRSFYMRKVKFTQDSFDEKLDQILNDFPKFDDIHPFYADLLNVLYDRDHYKLALSQLHMAKNLIDRVSKEYVRMLKFGDSLYRCKQLKIAALGRMATIMKRQKDSLAYLEQVRQHMSRLPSIDPNTRTLLLCGYPNVGKSSFMNKITRANVDVQPYAFTTKSLFVGHMDYQYLRWQVIDTPGILDHPLENRNTIEMQSITALAHLRACVLYFIDASEKCGYSIAEQVALYHNIKPLFANKLIMLVINKIDLLRPENISEEDKALMQSILDEGVQMVACSCFSDEGVMTVKETACQNLLAARVEQKMSGQKINDVLNKLHLAIPKARDTKERTPFIPENALTHKKYDKNDPDRIKLERDLEQENGGPGVYDPDVRKYYLLQDESWKYDVIPEIFNGKNVSDFIDPEIEARLKAIELDEETKESEGFYTNGDSTMDTEETPEETELLRKSKIIREKKTLAKNAAHINNGPKMRSRTTIRHTGRQIASNIVGSGAISKDTASSSRKMDKIRGLLVSKNRSMRGLKNVLEKNKSESLKLTSQRPATLEARKGESDRKILSMMPKHLFSGKRKQGTTRSR